MPQLNPTKRLLNYFLKTRHGKIATLSAPTLLEDNHLLDKFICGNFELDQWLKTQALFNHVQGGARTYVIVDRKMVKGFYSLAAGSVRREIAPGRIRRNMPNPIPVLILARLGVSKDYKGME